MDSHNQFHWFKPDHDLYKKEGGLIMKTEGEIPPNPTLKPLIIHEIQLITPKPVYINNVVNNKQDEESVFASSKTEAIQQNSPVQVHLQ